MKISFAVNKGILYCTSILFLSIQEVFINMMITEKNCTLVERLKFMCFGLTTTYSYGHWNTSFYLKSCLSMFYHIPLLKELTWIIRRPYFCLMGTFLGYPLDLGWTSAVFFLKLSWTVFLLLSFIANSQYDLRMYFIYIKYNSSFSCMRSSVEIDVE